MHRVLTNNETILSCLASYLKLPTYISISEISDRQNMYLLFTVCRTIHGYTKNEKKIPVLKNPNNIRRDLNYLLLKQHYSNSMLHLYLATPRAK